MASLAERLYSALSEDGVISNSKWSRTAIGVAVILLASIPLALQLDPAGRVSLLAGERSINRMLSDIAIFGLLVVGSGLVLRWHEPKTYRSPRILLLLASLVLSTVTIMQAITLWFPEIAVFILPIPVAAMLATLLVSARSGLLMCVASVCLAALIGIAEGTALVGILVWSLFGVGAASLMTQRHALFKSAGMLSAAGLGAALLQALSTGAPLTAGIISAGHGIIGGVLTVVLGYGSRPFLEKAFGITTDVSLMEMTDPAHPLLRELALKAPGTYSHSMMTGNLAETAAQKIGARPLLARAGAYYHDVGKIKRPDFFVENQTSGLNPHESRLPSLSALIITAHVREGVELARAHRLPYEVIDIIQQHHGTSLVTYFYNKATEGDAPVLEADFRYDGHLPRSREAALVMLADCAEAVAKTVKKPTSARIEAAVRRVIEVKMADGQLIDSQLTLADIEAVVQVYSKMLSSAYHSRNEYYEPRAVRLEHADKSIEPSRT